MKKSLSMILSLAVAFSMFSSVALGANAAGKTSNDFTDLKDLDAAAKEKFDAMIAAGIFDGVAEGTFGLHDKMNRAQFAKVAALVFGLKVDSTLKTSGFSDVTIDDPANGYALPYIEAIVKAGITDGFAPNQYNPAGEVTKEQLAAFLIRGLGMEDQAKTAKATDDKTVSTWAKGYVALAIEKKIMAAGADGLFGGTTAATRDLLVTSSYEAKQQFVKVPFNGLYGIESFKATDANEFTLQLNGAVKDTEAVKLSLKRNGSEVTDGYTLAWSEDKTTVVVSMDNKFDDAKWSVALGGLDNLDKEKSTAEAETASEKMEKIEFLSTSDTMPNNPGQKIRVDFKAVNQYGKQFSMSASDFDIYTSVGTQTPIGGEQAFYLTLPAGMERNEHITVTVLHKNSNMQVNKIFTVGDKPVVSKVVAGDLLDGSGDKIDVIDANGYAYLDVKAYDQYGFRVEDKDALNNGVIVSIPDSDLVQGNEGDTKGFVDQAVGDDAADLLLRSVSDKEKEITVTLFPNGSNEAVTIKVKVAAYKLPASVEFGNYSYNLTQGDTVTGDETTDNKMYIPIVVKDTAGNQLTAQEIYDNRSKLMIFSSSALTLANDPISNSGAHKGMIAVDRVEQKGAATVTVQLKDNVDANAQKTLNISDERKADTLKFSKSPAKYMIAGAENELKVKLYDQYGGEMKYDSNNQYVVRYALTANSGDAASLAATSLSSVQRTDETNSSSARKYVLNPTVVGTAAVQDMKLAHDASDTTVDTAFDKAFKFYTGADAKAASYSFKATLLKQDNQGTVVIGGKNYVEVNNLNTTMEVLDPSNVNNKLTYEAYLDKSNNTVLAADDYMDAGTGSAGATNVYENNKGFAKEVKIRAKKGNEEVKVPTNVVSVSTSDSQVVDKASKSNWIAGGKAGKAKLTVLFYDGKKDMINSSIDVTSKNEGPVVSAVNLKKTSKTVNLSDLQGNGLYLWDAKLAEKMTVTDQYAGEFVAEHAPGTLNEEGKSYDSMFVKANGAGYNSNEVLKISFYVSGIAGMNPDAVSIDPDTGLIKYDGAAGDVTSFTVSAVAPSGETASFDVNVK